MDIKAMSGLDILKAMQKSGTRPAMAKTMNVDLICIEDGMARFRCEPTKDHLNPDGGVHGGYAATALDSVISLAAQTKLKDLFNFRGTSDSTSNSYVPLGRADCLRGSSCDQHDAPNRYCCWRNCR